ncbi:MAG: tetraacyldisaccharide 4'-kinase [Gemmatimonadetes bacterium]|nr:MAG: tetraacyldisaccharide 4'-kinase [Gemmatimonadota bacterium]
MAPRRAVAQTPRLWGRCVVTLAPDLLEILVCPKCKGPLEHRTNPEALACHACRLIYAVEDDIPIMLIDEAKPF